MKLFRLSNETFPAPIPQNNPRTSVPHCEKSTRFGAPAARTRVFAAVLCWLFFAAAGMLGAQSADSDLSAPATGPGTGSETESADAQEAAPVPAPEAAPETDAEPAADAVPGTNETVPAESVADAEPAADEAETPGGRFAFGFGVQLFWQGQSEDTAVNGVETSPIVQALAFSFGVRISEILSFEPEIAFFYDEYLYLASLSRAVPTQRESGTALGPLAAVLGLNVSLPLVIDLRLSPVVSLRFRPGLAAFLRIPAIPLDGTEADDIAIISESLNAQARWLMPETGVGVGIRLSERTSAEFAVRVLYPLWHAWDERGIPFWDSLIVLGSLTVRFGF